MFVCITSIKITQIPSTTFPNRNEVYNLDFVNEFEIISTWKNLTTTAKITFPKNIHVLDQNGRPLNFEGPTQNIGGFSVTSSSNPPIILRGDQIAINAGYLYYDEKGNSVIDVNPLFEGYVSEVDARMPIKLTCEDNMWKLKQITAPNHTFPSTATLESILQKLLTGTGFTVNTLTTTTIGSFRTQNETVCQVLERLRKQYFFESYFRGNELRCGAIVYIDSESVSQNFAFQKNIISDELKYKRKDDIQLSAIAYSVGYVTTGKTNKDGSAKSKKNRLEAFVQYENGNFSSKIRSKSTDPQFPQNTGGERRTFHFLNITDPNQLVQLAKQELIKYYYTGLRGKFTTFLVPFVKFGDKAVISDSVLPERNGTYLIKGVTYKGGIEGMRQEITLDYKTPLDYSTP